MKIYGPYKRKDNRQHVVIVYDDGTKTTKSWPRVLMERHLGRKLLRDETVDHINNDKTDNRIENLQLLSLKENNLKEMTRPERKRKLYSFVCPNCGETATKYFNNVKGNEKKGRAGPFCSRSCAGKATYISPWKDKK